MGRRVHCAPQGTPVLSITMSHRAGLIRTISCSQSDLEASLLPEGSFRPLSQHDVDTLYSGKIPYSHCQPYLRVSKPENDKEEAELKKVDVEAKRKRAEQEEPVLGELSSTMRCNRRKCFS